jgi:hypothetical protein
VSISVSSCSSNLAEAGAGLSLAHTCPLEESGGGFPLDCDGTVRGELLAGRSLDKVPTVEIAVGGRLVALKGYGPGGPDRRGGGKRGRIVVFSRASRRRLMRKLASINHEVAGLPTFITLTYPGEFPSDSVTWKRHLHNFCRAMLRKFPGVAAFWRLEPQRRGAPHYHLLVWGLPWAYEQRRGIREWVSATWYRVVGSGDEKHLKAGTRVEGVKTWRGVMFYASKYIAKVDQRSFTDSPGRFWGVYNKEQI